MQTCETKIPVGVDVESIRLDEPVYEWYNPFFELRIICGMPHIIDEMVYMIADSDEWPEDSCPYYGGSIVYNGVCLAKYMTYTTEKVAKLIDPKLVINTTVDLFVNQLYVVTKFDSIQNFFEYIEQQKSSIITEDHLLGLYMSNDNEIYAKFPVRSAARFSEYSDVYYGQYYQSEMKDITHSALKYIGCENMKIDKEICI